MTLASGSRIGSYEVTAKLGEGGMGEVYRARDTKLDRDVAIKVLPESFASDADRVARFTREAKTLASLNHPNIAGIYGIEDNAIVMELVEGEDLSTMIGGLETQAALRIAHQIIEALEAAHEQGIVHRDLKPQNIKVREDGTVKVLDFGLAKAMDSGTSGPPDPNASPTMTARATQLGMVIGTAAYMAPEQARGKAVDRRADIWAFGVVLYEMLTGRRCFPGEEISDVLAAVLRQDIDWTALPSSTPARLRRLLERCLDRDPKQRLRDIGEARVELAQLEGGAGAAESGIGTIAQPAAQKSAAVPWSLAAALAVALVGGGVWLWPQPAPAPTLIQFAISPQEGTTFNPYPGFISISPDGQQIAYTTADGGDQKLWLRSVGSLEARRVEAATGGNQVAWSPDGQSLLLSASGDVRRVDLAGGSARRLAISAIDRPAWGGQGVVLFTKREGLQQLMRVPEAGGAAVPATTLDTAAGELSHSWPAFLPDGKRFVYLARNTTPSKSALFLASLDSTERTHLLDVHSMAEVALGYLLYQRDGTIFAHPFDDVSGRLTGAPVPIVDRVQVNAVNGRAAFATSRTGVLVYRSGESNDKSVLTWFDRVGKALGTLGQADAYYLGALSPDGRRFVVPVLTAAAGRDLMMIDIARNITSRFTSAPTSEDHPLWTIDGESVIFSDGRKGAYDLYIKNAGGATPERLLYESADPKQATGLSPDGKLLLFQSGPTSTTQSIWAMPLAGDPKPYRLLPNESGNHSDGRFSPDGKWVVYCAGSPKTVFVQPFPTTGYREQISADSGADPKWSTDGRQILFLGPFGTMNIVDVTPSGGKLRVGAPRELFRQITRSGAFGFTMDGRGERFLMVVPPDSGAGASQESLTVVVNWTSLLAKR